MKIRRRKNRKSGKAAQTKSDNVINQPRQTGQYNQSINVIPKPLSWTANFTTSNKLFIGGHRLNIYSTKSIDIFQLAVRS